MSGERRVSPCVCDCVTVGDTGGSVVLAARSRAENGTVTGMPSLHRTPKETLRSVVRIAAGGLQLNRRHGRQGWRERMVCHA